MADYWKSNPRKFCEFCQCWYADNKSSKEFHERGKRHKENVEKKIGELRKKGQKQYETQQQLSGFLKQMEEDAMKAFKKDVASNPDLIPEYKVALVENRVRQQLEDPTAVQGSRFQAGQSGGPSGTQGTSPSASSTQAQQEWVEDVSPEGYTYYWNTKTGVTQWDKPANFTSLSSSSSQDKGSSNEKVEEKEDSDEDNEKGEEKEEEEKNTGESENTSRGTKRKNDAYGGWTTVSTEPEEEPDLQLPEANPHYMSSYVPQAAQYEPREKLEIQEKKVGSIKASSREASGSVSFKKRKGGQRQIRSRDSTS